ncbi:LytR family transcriptional regulator [Bacteroidetes/Chlorobi group bacterium ChocPot_Mid]|nr:MAG: LytR family transcriptional regulator [Bacteroidetes/Chlorobi group bacterium ChocPot_Mid]
MDKKTKSKILSISLISLLSLLILVFIISMIFKFVSANKSEKMPDNQIGKLNNNEMIQISVLNGCGVKGLASKVRDYLRDKGFDVVDVGNYNQQTKFSFVIDWIGDTLSAKKLANAIGVPESKIIHDIDSSLYLRGSIVIGSDFKNLKAFK